MESATTTSASAKPARKRNRKSRANREPASASGASGSVGTGSPGGTAAGAEAAGALDGDGAGSELGALLIDVVCGVNRAKLRVDGLRNGSKTPCVYMETDDEELGQGQGEDKGQGRSDSWMTPNQFQHASGRGTARDWKRSIKHHGTSLKSLISSHVLTVDPPHCRCAGCSGAATAPAAINGYSIGALNVLVNGDHSPLNLSLIGATTRQSPSNISDVIDEKPEVTRRRKAELMTSLRLTDLGRDSPTPEVEISTDWNGNHLLHEPPPSKRRRTDCDEDEAEDSEDAVEKGRSSLFSVLAACSFTDVYNAYQRRRARLQPEVSSSAGNETDPDSGSGLTAEVDEHVVESMERKSASPTWDIGEGALANVVPSTDNGVYPLAASLRQAMSGEDRDATLTHIIYELRDYKKRLVEQIDASRARATTHHDDQLPVTDHPSTPPAAACLVPTPHLPAISPASSGHLAATKPRKELPDLVRSSIPPVVGATKSTGGGRTTTIWNPALSLDYSVDSCGALDLTTRHHRPATVTSHDYPPPSSEMVLDLSCRRQEPSFSPPVMTSSLRAEVVSASRSRRHNRKSTSSGSIATGRHDDHDSPLSWSVRDVIEFVSEVPGCQAYAETFKRFGVRGASLPVLSVDHMTGILRMRHDAARSLRAAIDSMMTSYVTTATVAAAVAGCQSPSTHHQRRLEQTESAVGVS